MKRTMQQHPLELRIEKIARGYRGIEDKTMCLVFEEGKLLPDEVVTRLQKGSDALATAKPRSTKPKVGRAEEKQHPHLLGPGCDGANLVEEVVTTIVEDVVIPIEEERRHPGKARCRSPKRSHSRR